MKDPFDQDVNDDNCPKCGNALYAGCPACYQTEIASMTAELQAAKQDSELLKHAEAMAVAAEAIEELEVSLMDDVGVFKYEAALEALSSATKAYRAAIKADQAGRA